MVRLADETGVLLLSDRMHGHEKIVDVHPMRRALIVVAVLGSHQEVPGRDQRELREQVSRHRFVDRIAQVLLGTRADAPGGVHPFRVSYTSGP
jgi:hypothetical protein